jgi:predicted nucleic acid-binding protein
LRQVVKPDDWYLVQAYLTAKADAIITTDESLKEVLSSHNLPVLLRDEVVEGN